MNNKFGLILLFIVAYAANYLFRQARNQLTPEQKAAVFDVQNAQYSLNLYLLGSLIFFGGLYLLVTYAHLPFMTAVWIAVPFLFLVGVVRTIIYYRQLKAKQVPQSYLNAIIKATALLFFGLLAYISTILIG